MPIIHAVEEKLTIEPPPSSRIERRAIWRGEELVFEVQGDRLVPVLLADFVDVAALIVGGVVDQDADRPQPLARLLHRRLERRDVGQVAFDEEGRRAGRAEPRGERLRRFGLDVDEDDVGLLPDEGLDHRRANSGASAGDEDDLVDERRVAGGGHSGLDWRWAAEGQSALRSREIGSPLVRLSSPWFEDRTASRGVAPAAQSVSQSLHKG